MRNDQQMLLEKKNLKRKESTMEMKIELTFAEKRFKSCFEGGAASQQKDLKQIVFLFFRDNYNILKHDRRRVLAQVKRCH